MYKTFVLTLICFGLQGYALVYTGTPYSLLRLSCQYPDSALSEANRILKQPGYSSVEKSYALLAKGLVFTQNELTSHAERYLEKAMVSFESSGDNYGKAYSHLVYAELKGHTEEQENLLKRALNFAPDSARGLTIHLLNSLAKLYEKNQASHKAEDLLKKTIYKAITKGDSLLLREQYNLLLRHYLTHNKWTEVNAIRTYLRTYFKGTTDEELKYQLVYAKAYQLFEMNRYSEAKDTLLADSPPQRFPEQVEQANELLRKIALREGDYNGAIYHYQKADSLNQVKQAQIQNALSLMETEYESQLQGEQLTFLEASAKSDAYIRVALILLIGLALTLVFNIYYFQRKRIISLKLLRANEQNQAELERKVLESELKKERLLQSNLDDEIQNTKEELHDFSENFIRNDQLLNDLRTKVRKLRRNVSDPAQKEKLRELNVYLQQSNNHDPARRAFVENALKLDDEFLFKLQSRFPQLTEQDIHLLVFIMLGVDSAELASIYNIERSSIMTKRYRLRKKLGMESDQTFDHFIKENL